MGFKDVIYQENNRYHHSSFEMDKNQLFERSKYYILLQELLADIQVELASSEEICGFLPMTVAENTAATNQGIGGMGYARTKKAKQYVKNFSDTRGNRLFIFTNQRIIYLIILDYLEDKNYFSYPYKEIHSIYLEPHPLSYRDPKGMKKKEIVWYYVDFQAGNHIFSEIFTETDAEVFRKNWQEIEAFHKIPQAKRIYRQRPFDRIMSNLQFSGRLLYFLNFLLILLAILLVFGVLLGIGPMRGMYYKDLISGQASPLMEMIFFQIIQP